MNTGMTRRLLPWIPSAIASLIAAGLLLTFWKIPVPLCLGIIWLMFPLVAGAIFLRYNQRRVIHWMLSIFLTVNGIFWLLFIGITLVSGPGAHLLGLFYVPLLDNMALFLIFCLWFAINSWEILAGD